MRRVLFLTSTLLTIAVTLSAQAPPAGVDLATINRIRGEAITQSQAMATHWWLSEVFGPRATGTPAYTRGAEWSPRSGSFLRAPRVPGSAYRAPGHPSRGAGYDYLQSTMPMNYALAVMSLVHHAHRSHHRRSQNGTAGVCA